MAAKKAIPPSSDDLPFGAGAVDTPVEHPGVKLADPPKGGAAISAFALPR